MKRSSEEATSRRLRLLWYNACLLHGIELTPALIRTLVSQAREAGTPGAKFLVSVELLVAVIHRVRAGTHVTLGAKPALEARAAELGQELDRLAERKDVDATVAALGEIFGPEVRGIIEGGLCQPFDAAYGPPIGSEGIVGTPPRWLARLARLGHLPVSSGLLTLSNGLPVVRVEREAFRLQDDPAPEPRTWLGRGHPVRDPDFWANKGVLLTEFDTGFGHLELYTTHLFSGQVIGESLLMSLDQAAQRYSRALRGLGRVLSSVAPRRARLHLERYREYFDLHPDKRRRVQDTQLGHLIEFVGRHHRPENVVIIAGDFNIDSNQPHGTETPLMEMLSPLCDIGVEMEDTWQRVPARERHLGTVVDPLRLFMPANGQARGPRSASLFAPERIDYILVQKPAPEHAMKVQVVEAAVREFERAARAPGAMRYLSDHLGLEVVLEVATL